MPRSDGPRRQPPAGRARPAESLDARRSRVVAVPASGPARGAAPRPERQAPARRTAGAGRPRHWRAIWANGRLAALLAAFVFASALAYLLTAGACAVARLDLSGASATAAEEVAAAGQVMGDNVFTVDPQGVAARLAALPTVRVARVWTELPDRLVVTLEERQGSLLWQIGDDRFLVDDSGFVISANPPAESTQGLLTVRANAGEPPTVGGYVDGKLVHTALTVARPPTPDLALPVAGMEVVPGAGLTLTGEGGWRIVLGNDTRIADKLAVCAALLRGERGWKTLDVSDPDRPVIKE